MENKIKKLKLWRNKTADYRKSWLEKSLSWIDRAFKGCQEKHLLKKEEAKKFLNLGDK